MSGSTSTNSTPLHLEDIRLQVLKKICQSLVSYLIPTKMRFVGERAGGWWPRNALLPLIRVFPALRDSIYEALCSVCELSFCGTANRQARINSASVATEFFGCIGPENLRFAKQVELVFSEKPGVGAAKFLDDQEDSIFDFLSLTARHVPPPRLIKHIPLEVELEQSSPSEPTSPPCYIVKGLGGPRIIFAFPARRNTPKIQRNDLFALSHFISRRTELRFNIDKLPCELRLMIYEQVFPIVRRTFLVEAWRWKMDGPPFDSNYRRSKDVRNLLCASRDMHLVLSRWLYENTLFNFDYDWHESIEEERWVHEAMQKEAPERRDWPQHFLEIIGSSNAGMIRQATITFRIVREVIYTPSIRCLVNDLQDKSSIKLEADWELHVKRLDPIFEAGPHFTFVNFNVPTTNGSSLTLRVRLLTRAYLLDGSLLSNDWSSALARQVLSESLRGMGCMISDYRVIRVRPAPSEESGFIWTPDRS